MNGMDDGFEDFGPGPNAGSAPKDSPTGGGGPWRTSMTNSCVTPKPVQRVSFSNMYNTKLPGSHGSPNP